MQFSDILEKYRKESRTQREKGTKFEELIQRFFQTDPTYASRLANVWLWNEFPFRKDLGGIDSGIDIVAETLDGEFWAIQCKCYEENHVFNQDSVAGFLAASSRTFRNEELKSVGFSLRIWVSTTRKFGIGFDRAISDQNPPVKLLDLSYIENAPIDWEKLDEGLRGEKARSKHKKIREHQKKALELAHEYFKEKERGKLIMACGTGKTFTALKIAEDQVRGKKDGGLVLCLVPSIALVGQMLREWTADAEEPINAICVCSDPSVSKKHSRASNDDVAYGRVEDLALPASTDPKDVARQIRDFSLQEGLTVVFSTYHSIEVISKAQKRLNGTVAGDGVFDLIICDEAHRTTGVTLVDKDESAFVKVHNNDFIRAKRRLYMTATPKLYHETTKKKAEEKDAILCSMDDVGFYGDEIYSLSFGEAVKQNLLADYKVLVLTLSETQIGEALKNELAGKISEDEEIPIEDLRKLVGCINALSKRMLVNKELLSSTDPAPMRRAVAFCRTIDVSRRTSKVFKKTEESYLEHLSEADRNTLVEIETDHVDGSMTASERDRKLCWLRDPELKGRTCRILTNVRCLSEGVDVPALDAILFLSPRSSQIEVVQAVGRVMRTAPDKKYGYIILPVVISEHAKPEDVLSKDNQRFRIVWSVLNALRSHDKNFEATVHKLNLTKRQPNDKIIIGPVPDVPIVDFDSSQKIQDELNLLFEQLPGEIYVKMVEKVGDRSYWERWARDVGEIAKRHIERIRKLIAVEGNHKKAFKEFCAELRQNINPSISDEEVIEMLAQHIVSKPVFDALFANHTFTESNAISRSMSKMLQTLEEQELDKDHETLKRFYDSVRERVDGIDTAEGKQKIIVELYDKFFKMAFPKVVEKLGIVYTPMEIVDFLIHSVESVLQKEFRRSLSDENIHILDPFTGTGTFITRLLQSGIISKEKLLRKYKNEIHANEIVLLAYYIACVNIENAFAEVSGSKTYESFPGACLTDTFQLGESGHNDVGSKVFPENSERVLALKKTPIRVILGNPPYSVGQKTGNDNAQNQHYENLENRIRDTYVANTSAQLSMSLYDSYVKAFRWASDRIDENGGIIAFVTNGGWLDGVAFDGFRKCLEEEFSKIYVFNLRGNQRTKGETSRREGGKIFGAGSRTPVALTVLVKNKKTQGKKAQIFYRDIGDYLSREEKLKIIAEAHDVEFRDGGKWTKLTPNEHGDWINLRNEKFDNLTPLAPEKALNPRTNSIFVLKPNGAKTNRDAWVYNFSRKQLCKAVKQTIDFYNSQVELLGQNPKANIDANPQRFSWEDNSKRDVKRGKRYDFSHGSVRTVSYRPFQKQNLYFSTELNSRVAQVPVLFPKPDSENLVICVQGKGGTTDFSCFVTNVIPDLGLIGGSQCFPLYYYEEKQREELFDTEGGLIRRDGVSDFALKEARHLYGNRVSREDIFYYVYGILHSPDYRKEFATNLKISTPKVPFVEAPNDFWAFSKAGRDLANLHLNYETLPLPKGIVATCKSEKPDYRVSKMRFDNGLKERDHPEKILYNDKITIGPIPKEAYDYVVNGKSAIGWVMDRYQVSTDKNSGITNDPNLWCEEHRDPEYIVNLLRRVIYLSCKTVEIVKGLPKIDFSEY